MKEGRGVRRREERGVRRRRDVRRDIATIMKASDFV